ncbi:MAG: hypothetical protein R3E89_17350 [Thiolinea sp.]
MPERIATASQQLRQFQRATGGILFCGQAVGAQISCTGGCRPLANFRFPLDDLIMQA